MPEGELIRIFIVDHDKSSNQQLQHLLQGGSYELQTFVSGNEIERQLAGLPVGIVLLSLDLPDRGCLDVLQSIVATRPDLAVIAMRTEPQVKAIVKAMRNGVVDFVEKPIELGALQLALQSCNEKLARAAGGAAAGSIEAKLTQRQFQVLKLLVAGQQNRRVGEALGISERTVEIHRARVMKLLEVKNFAALVRLATKQGIEP